MFKAICEKVVIHFIDSAFTSFQTIRIQLKIDPIPAYNRH